MGRGPSIHKFYYLRESSIGKSPLEVNLKARAESTREKGIAHVAEPEAQTAIGFLKAGAWLVDHAKEEIHRSRSVGPLQIP